MLSQTRLYASLSLNHSIPSSTPHEKPIQRQNKIHSATSPNLLNKQHLFLLTDSSLAARTTASALFLAHSSFLYSLPIFFFCLGTEQCFYPMHGWENAYRHTANRAHVFVCVMVVCIDGVIESAGACSRSLFARSHQSGLIR